MGSLLSHRSRALSSMAPTDVKIVLLGNAHVGKTSLAKRFVHGIFQETISSSVGGLFMTKTIQSPKAILQIWDTASIQNIRSKLPDVSKGADCAILVYDLSNRDSFVAVMDFWIEYVKTNASEHIVTVLVGNKCDIPIRQVTNSEGKNLAERHGMLFVETSAKNRINVDKIFIDAATAALETPDQLPPNVNCPSRAQLIEYGKEKQRKYCMSSD